ncbi:MAG: GAF domain-containing protein [Candidatus Electryonea clarkiae]|nr:GAF domain-containing protein [Candidatus Electryonea clarkiae]MDP8286719.1 GAF domain-containing protein [Candidatus Electryonea clarkiae]
MDINLLIEELEKNENNLSFPNWEKEIVERLLSEIPHYSWIGFYWVKGDRLELGAWEGPEATEHVSIPVGEGICGLAARTKETVIVDDVDERPEYIACFPGTKSEIVVPIIRGGETIGEIDIDGDKPAAFTGKDRRALERLAEIIAEKYPH